MSVCPRAHMFGHFDDHMLACTYALMHTCSYMLGLSHVYMEDRILLYSHLDAHLLDWSHAWMLTSLNAHTLTCFDNHMLAHMPFWSYATMPHVLMITCSHAHIHWYSHVSYPYTCAHTWLMIYLYAWRLKWSCNCTFLCSNALTTMLECWGNWGVKGMCTWVLQCLYAFVLMCLYSPTHMFVCSHA